LIGQDFVTKPIEGDQQAGRLGDGLSMSWTGKAPDRRDFGKGMPWSDQMQNVLLPARTSLEDPYRSSDDDVNAWACITLSKNLLPLPKVLHHRHLGQTPTTLSVDLGE
jgi:hypothetical protein